jgi:N-acetylneuraminic acid mutarotase
VGTKIYVPGGFNSVDFGGPLNNMQIYDTATDTWSQGAVLPAARSGVATAAFNNLVYVIAGYNPVGTGHNDVYIYNPATNTYTTGAPMPGVAGNVPGVLLAGEIYVVGGGTAPGASFAYNPTTNSWRTIAVLPTTNGLCQSGNGFVLSGELWIVGCLGLPLAQQVWIYNPGTNSWRAGQRRSPGTRQRAVQRSRLRRWRWQRIRWLDGGRVGRNGRPATTATATTAATASGCQLHGWCDHDSGLGTGCALPVDLCGQRPFGDDQRREHDDQRAEPHVPG